NVTHPRPVDVLLVDRVDLDTSPARRQAPAPVGREVSAAEIPVGGVDTFQVRPTRLLTPSPPGGDGTRTSGDARPPHRLPPGRRVEIPQPRSQPPPRVHRRPDTSHLTVHLPSQSNPPRHTTSTELPEQPPPPRHQS